MPRSNSPTQLPSQRCGQHGYGLWNAPGRCVHRAGKTCGETAGWAAYQALTCANRIHRMCARKVSGVSYA